MGRRGDAGGGGCVLVLNWRGGDPWNVMRVIVMVVMLKRRDEEEDYPKVFYTYCTYINKIQYVNV